MFCVDSTCNNSIISDYTSNLSVAMYEHFSNPVICNRFLNV